MGVYIKDMKMPKNCAYCQFLQSNGEIFKRELFCGLDSTNDIHGYKPNKGCPLVPVPEHGDLIDINALKLAIVNVDYVNKHDYLKGVLNAINNAPTVIPVDKDGGT